MTSPDLDYINALPELQAIGFHANGYARVDSLLSSASRKVIPAAGGVYVILCLDSPPPEFVLWPYGSKYVEEGVVKELNYPLERLRACWVEGSVVMYIGKADVLRKRLSQYIRYYARLLQCQALRQPFNKVSHRGGRAVWQLQGCGHFIVAWSVTAAPPEAEESRLLSAYRATHNNHLPLANKRN